MSPLRLPRLAPDQPEWFPPNHDALLEPNGLLCAGGDLQPARLLAAYRRGVFPWFSPGEPILWWTPDPRCVLPLARRAAPASRFLRWLRQCDWQLSADRHFAAVMNACAAPRMGQRGTWITPGMRLAYERMYQLGYCHSVEVLAPSGELIGGIYGIAIGKVFFGESMFSRVSQASKVALWALVAVLRAQGFLLLDGQAESPHLMSLGFVCLPRTEFLARLALAATACESWPGSWTLTQASALAEFGSATHPD